MKQEYPAVSIVIPSFNGKNFLGECLKSISHITYPREKWEVILVENASTDGSEEYVKTRFPWVRILSLDRNYGFSAVNRGAATARGEFLVFLNNDTKVDPGWLSNLAEAAFEFGPHNIYASKTVHMADPRKVDYSGGKIPVNGRGFSPHLGESDTGETDIRPTGYPCAASMWIRKDVFQELGGFDGDYFACHDDVDLGIRAWLRGFRVYLVPTSVVFHRVSGTVGDRRTYFSVYHHTKNAIQNVLKNFEPKNVVVGLLLEAFFDLYQLATFLVGGHREGGQAIFEAYRWVMQNFRSIVDKRGKVQAARVRPDSLFHELGLSAGLRESLKAYRRVFR